MQQVTRTAFMLCSVLNFCTRKSRCIGGGERGRCLDGGVGGEDGHVHVATLPRHALVVHQAVRLGVDGDAYVVLCGRVRAGEGARGD